MSQVKQPAQAPKQTASVSGEHSTELQASEFMLPTLQRSVAPLEQISPQNVLYLQSAIGNTAVQRLVAPRRARTATRTTTQPSNLFPQAETSIQRKLAVGPAGDKYEREADEISKQVVRRQLANRVQRVVAEKPQVGPDGGSLDSVLESSIRHSSNGGSAMPVNVRRQIEPSLGAGLSHIKVHTDSQSAHLNRQLGAKAFTHKNHIYYGAGQSPSDIKLTAHEAVHTIQQGETQVSRKPLSGLLQRIYQHPDNNKWYSHVLPKQEITDANGVITASATGGPGGGHAILVFEYLDGTGAHTMKVDLTAGGANMSSGKASGEKGPSVSRGTTAGASASENITSGSTSSQSSTTAAIQINMGEASDGSIKRLITAQKRSWVVTKGQIETGLQEAIKVQSDMATNVGKYSYKLFGRSIFAKNPMNCASFGERVLQKAGVKASATSWWFGTKLPSTLASGQNVGYTPDTAFPAPRKASATVAPPTATPVRGVDTAAYDHIKDLAFRRVNFSEGKTIAGDVTEFDPKGMPSTLFTFKADPTTATELPTSIFKVTVHKDIGLARLETPVGAGVVRAAFVKLTDLFNSSGAIITT